MGEFQNTVMDENKRYHFLMFLAKPKSSNPESNDFEGAYVNVWIPENEGIHPEAMASQQIDWEGWVVEDLKENHFVSRRGYQSNSKYSEQELKNLLAVLDSASEDGLAIEFYCWERE